MAQELPHQDGLDEYLTRAFEGYEGETPPDRVWEAIGRDLDAAAPLGAGRVRALRLRAGWLLPAAAAAAALLVAGYLLLHAHTRIEALRNQVADQGRQIEQLLVPSPGAPAPEQAAAARPDVPGAAAPPPAQAAPPAEQGSDKQGITLEVAPPRAPDTPAEPAVAAEPPPLPPAPAVQRALPALTVLGPRRTDLPGSAASMPAHAPAPAPASFRGVAWKVSLTPQHLLPAGPPPSHGDWVAPQRMTRERDLRAGIALRLRDRKRLSLEGGIYVQQRREQTLHAPRLRYRREGGSWPEQQFRYRLYTSGDAQEVSVTLSRTAEPAPDSVQIPLTVETLQRSTSVSVPLTLRLSTRPGPWRLSVRAGAVVQYRLSGSLELLEVASGSPYFRYESAQQPAARTPFSGSAWQVQYLAGAGVEWALSPRLSMSLEPGVQFRPGSSQEGSGGRHGQPGYAFAGLEAGIYCRF
jgi:hypothetical protein